MTCISVLLMFIQICTLRSSFMVQWPDKSNPLPNRTPLIFQIGFNKCGTVSLYLFFSENGIPSMHFKNRSDSDVLMNQTLQRQMAMQYLADNAVLQPLTDDHFVFFSDFGQSINGTPWYRILHQQYGAQYNLLFILNIRNVQHWLQSRFMQKYRRRKQITTIKTIRHWKVLWYHYHCNVLQYFHDHNLTDHLLIFDIEQDPTDKMIHFLRQFNIIPKTTHFPHSNNKKSADPLRIRQKWKQIEKSHPELAVDYLDHDALNEYQRILAHCQRNAITNPMSVALHSIDSNMTLSVDQRRTVCHNVDDALCVAVSNPICKYILRYPVLYQNHHKTGFALSKKMARELNIFCGISKANQSRIMKRLDVDDIPPMLLSHSSFTNHILFHFMRSPISTILSGFYYHKKANEPWLLTTPMKMSSYLFSRVQNIELYSDVMMADVNKSNFYQKYWDVSAKVTRCFSVPLALDKFADPHNWYSVRYEHSVQTFYNELVNEQMGLFWEFIRYFNCEWPQIYLMRRIGLQHFTHYHRFNLDDFGSHSGFVDNMNVFVDILNVMDSEQNRQILRHRNGTHIQRERSALLKLLQRHDLHKSESTKNRGHVTAGEYDRNVSIAWLLSVDTTVCLILRNLTLWLDFDWYYAAYC
eukprot:193236_1